MKMFCTGERNHVNYMACLHTINSQQEQQQRRAERHRDATFEIADEVLIWIGQPGRSQEVLKNSIGCYVVFRALRRISPMNCEVSLVLPHQTKGHCPRITRGALPPSSRGPALSRRELLLEK